MAALIAWMLVVRIGNLVKDGAISAVTRVFDALWRRRLRRSSILDKITNTNRVLSKRSRPLSLRSLSVCPDSSQDLKPPSPPQQLAHDLGGVVHHGDDAGIVEPRRAGHAEHADDAAGGVVIGR